MIDYKKHKYHADGLGGEQGFNEYIDAFHKLAPWLSDEEIEAILYEEEEKEIPPMLWYLN